MDDVMRFGFIAVLGAPNAGKSTLINRIVGAKVSIVSPKVQTTRTRVLGIVISGRSQLVFVDTPGIFSPRQRLDRAMVDAAWKGAADADLLAMIVDSERGFDANAGRIIKQIKADAVLVLNKVDQVPREKLLALSQEINEAGDFRETFMISALNGDGVADLTDYLRASLPEGVWMFPEDQLSDMPMRLMAAEIVREKLFLQLHQELPYALTAETEDWKTLKDGSARIAVVIIIERDSHKGMVLGKGGQRIKAVGSAAREELEAMFDCKVHLFLHVKVRRDWKDKTEHYHALGLDFPN
ncbi:MAG: GTPase Era [Rhodospirillaceae bacterium]|nr:GTPase Era [Rhodospirillaceae bacterium]|tara:strand:- start:269 stop:1159 length:891 start_codon:yes stop_codon:yes gene_type:complete